MNIRITSFLNEIIYRSVFLFFGVFIPVATAMAQSPLHHKQIKVKGIPIHVVEGGGDESPAVVFLHGWPENWTQFKEIIKPLSENVHVVALDLPGIGRSMVPIPSGEKQVIANYVHGVIRKLALQDVILAGHDIGGQIVYAYLHAYPDGMCGAVIMDVPIPGVEPWAEVKKKPILWHFRFYQTPEIPEILIAGHQASYFRYFIDHFTAGSSAVSDDELAKYVEAYSRPGALHTAFEWYRAFPEDAKYNRSVENEAVHLPVLYLGGEYSTGRNLERYVEGLREGGLLNVEGQIIENSGHYITDEQPAQVLEALRQFIERSGC